MKLNFERLPLLEVRLQFVFDQFLSLEFDSLVKIRNSVIDQLPQVEQRSTPQLQPNTFQLHFGAPPLLAKLSSDDGAVSAEFQPTVVFVRWQAPLERLGKEKYPRYPFLRGLAAKILDSLMSLQSTARAPIFVNLTYANFLEDLDGELSTKALGYFTSDAVPGLALKSALMHDMNYSYRRLEGGDLRLQVLQSTGIDGRSGVAIITSGGKQLEAEESYLSCLDFIHGFMQPFFLEILSDQGKKEFGLAVDANH